MVPGHSACDLVSALESAAVIIVTIYHASIFSPGPAWDSNPYRPDFKDMVSSV